MQPRTQACFTYVSKISLSMSFAQMLRSLAIIKMADETDDPGDSEKKDNKFLGYVLYSYNANRPSSAEVEEEANEEMSSLEEGNANKSVSDFLRKEATANHDFSLSVLTSNLSGEQETELRTFIAKRLARGTVYSGSGNMAVLDAGTVTSCGCQCYYCLLRGEKEDEWTELRDPTSNEDSYLSKDYVVCFVSSGETGLELFQDELDEYSTNLLPHLEKSAEYLDMQAEFRFLETWFEDNAMFLCRCTEYFKDDVSVLIHCGLVGTKLNVTSEDLRIQRDIKMFVEACSIVKLLNSLSGSNQQLMSKTQTNKEPSSVPKAMSVKIDGSSYGFSSSVTTQFCKEWSKTMLSGNVQNAVFLRQVIENYKLKVIQDMNTLKRLFRQAETDHYALYRSYIFLVKCGNGPVLLRNTKLEALTLNATDTLNIIKALEDFIEESGTFKPHISSLDSIS